MNLLNKKVAFYTLGCKLNFAETSTISRFFTDKEIKVVKFNEIADYYVINTCSVTSNANKKSRNAIVRATKKNPNAIIIVTGCYAQLKPHEIKNICGVDYIFGANNKDDIEKIIETSSKLKKVEITTTDHKDMKSFFPAVSKGDRTRAFLKVQDGCDYFCAYCTIPYARGRSRNLPVKEIIKQAEFVAANNIKEIIISGVNIGDFGKSSNETFFDLLKKLVEVENIQRYRIGSIEPNLLTDEMIEFIANQEKIMPHFHIPLQAGSDEVLKKIKRKYNTALFKSKIEKIKSLMPNAFIGIDLIVGVNGETKENFNETIKFVKSLDISYIHYFQYSERENTPAINFEPKISPTEKHERAKIIDEISKTKHKSFLSSQINKKFQVLFESSKKGNKMFGFTNNYIKVVSNYDKSLVNQIVDVEIVDFYDDETMQIKIL
ncbi:MAG TPA: tRNA (N(6)-L-threonylcarbamoyladenosine(37)-C(2))-methylthiotransferase MtaB [Bacteroidales bacterium]|nr:tRNA (N(6)-L-threonylcarbamoyladenosine(37)-C(2))-methylthiotransferase MtaB [Bacteroidales bacterium]HOR60728.1 tRNA (N(6)-L-threonylcarbamoyladenosine(37)-C(2))-methylthiotransferase MtaB [Bacteroidales bacterium]HPL05161.1 tRNA (N(6)-L-threonylcarbamoyladenosine(37)-C(2))-methylthiotransferase MtaB [Bacteroidales bacterium]